MNLRDFLETRERELLEAIDRLHGQLAPLEAELAEVRRAKGALGISPSEADSDSGTNALLRSLAADTVFGVTNIEEAVKFAIEGLPKPAELVHGTLHEIRETVTNALRLTPRVDPYAALTMKQLVVKALTEHFPQGATTRQLLEFFRDGWNRNIERANLSPQISRLYQEGIIGRADGTHEWYLVPESRIGRKPFRLLTKAFDGKRLLKPGETVWLLPHEVGAHHAPIDQPEAPIPDPDED
jgi:hypothetical protein